MRKETFIFIIKIAWLLFFVEYVLGMIASNFGIDFFMHVFYYFNIPVLVVLHIWGVLSYWDLKKKKQPAPLTWINPKDEDTTYRSTDGCYLIESTEGVFKIYCNNVYLGFETTADLAKQCCEAHNLNPVI